MNHLFHDPREQLAAWFMSIIVSGSANQKGLEQLQSSEQSPILTNARTLGNRNATIVELAALLHGQATGCHIEEIGNTCAKS